MSHSWPRKKNKDRRWPMRLAAVKLSIPLRCAEDTTGLLQRWQAVTQTARHHEPQEWNRHGLMKFENRMPGTVCGPKTEEPVRRWREVHNQQLRYLYCSQNIIATTMLEGWDGRLTLQVCYGRKRSAYKILVAKAWRKETTWKTQA
jgi:hypothetical protein